jgi:EAL domain-containing protein (putative c-di-GMP-specific phosphodiesterase class I)
MAHSLGIQVIAEGVETPEQLRYLLEQGCDELQGYYFSRPVPVDDIAALLRQGLKLDLVGYREIPMHIGAHPDM